MIATISPTDGKLIRKFDALSDSLIEHKIVKAYESQLLWKDELLSKRILLFKNLAAVIRNRKAELASIATLEMGKLLREAELEIEKSANCIEYYIANAETFLSDEEIEIDYGKALVTKSPIGVVLAVMPWNFPYWQVFRFAVPALLAGNVALLKHASNVPQCAIEIEKLFVDAGFPDGIFQTLLIEASQVEGIIENEKVHAVTLTGSEFAGASVASVASKHIKKSVLELGGSDAFVVLEKANLKKAVLTAVKSRLINCGQSCIAAKRFIVHQSLIEEFSNEMKMHFESIIAGDPMDDNSQLSPLAKMELIIDLEKQIALSVNAGAKILCGGKRLQRPGYFFEPTIVTNVKAGMPLFDEETFGPAAAIISFETNDEAITLANQSRFGLGGSVWSEDKEEALVVARKINSGSVYVNQLMKSDIRLPFGGTKKSGYGKELSRNGFMEWVNLKSVVIS